MRRLWLFFLSAVFMLSLLGSTACSKEENSDENPFYIYYLSQNSRELLPIRAVIDLNYDIDILVPSIWEHMRNGADAENSNFRSACSQDVSLLNDTVDSNHLILNFSTEYHTMQKIQEVLFRAAVVKTFVQLPGVSSVEIRVENQPLTIGNITIGPQTSKDFVDILGDGIDAYMKSSVVLYFAADDANYLRSVEVEVAYDAKLTLEQAVIERLILGPSAESNMYPVLPNTTKLLSVSTVNGICSVNFTESLLDDQEYMDLTMEIYAIVNTLTEIPGLSGVKISVNGNPLNSVTEIEFPDVLARNLDFVEGE